MKKSVLSGKRANKADFSKTLSEINNHVNIVSSLDEKEGLKRSKN
jgi:hypothetical protein